MFAKKFSIERKKFFFWIVGFFLPANNATGFRTGMAGKLFSWQLYTTIETKYYCFSTFLSCPAEISKSRNCSCHFFQRYTSQELLTLWLIMFWHIKWGLVCSTWYNTSWIKSCIGYYLCLSNFQIKKISGLLDGCSVQLHFSVYITWAI